jgi:hypothetical protein
MSHWDEYINDNSLQKDTQDYSDELQEYWQQLYPSDGSAPKENQSGAKIIPLNETF